MKQSHTQQQQFPTSTEWIALDGTVITLSQLLLHTSTLLPHTVSIHTLESALINWPQGSREWQRVAEVGLAQPPIILVHTTGAITIADGHHRIHRARQLGHTIIAVKSITLSELPAVYTRVFGC